MSYFREFPSVFYKFGDNPDATIYQNVGAYIDLVDQVKDDASFYTEYSIMDGDRPDQISQKLYGRPDLDWTFRLMNEDIKFQGWPLSYRSLTEKASYDYPNTTINTRTDISSKFKVGSIVTGETSGQRARVTSKRTDFGQLIVERVNEDRVITQTVDVKGTIKLELDSDGVRFHSPTDWIVTDSGEVVNYNKIEDGGDLYPFVEYDFGEDFANRELVFNTKICKNLEPISFVDGEVISTIENGVTKTAVVDTTVSQHNSTHHYEDSTGEYFDIVPNAPYTQRLSYDVTLTAGDSLSILFASDVTDFELSPTNDYSETIDLTNLQERIDAGEFAINAQTMEIGHATTQLVDQVNTTVTAHKALTQFVKVVDSSDNVNDYTNTLLTQGGIVYDLAQKDSFGNADITIHSFWIVDNQNNVVDDLGIYSIGFKYINDSGNDVFRAVHVDSGVQSIVTDSNEADHWAEMSTNLELKIQENFDDLEPSFLNPVTYLDRMVRQNDELRQMRVIRPELIDRIEQEFHKEMNEAAKTVAEVEAEQANTDGTGNITVTKPAKPVTDINGMTVTKASADLLDLSSLGSNTKNNGYY